jgi:hypothetical protein
MILKHKYFKHNVQVLLGLSYCNLVVQLKSPILISLKVVHLMAQNAYDFQLPLQLMASCSPHKAMLNVSYCNQAIYMILVIS